MQLQRLQQQEERKLRENVSELGLQVLPFQCGPFQVPRKKNQKSEQRLKPGGSASSGVQALQVLCVDDAGAVVLSGLQLHRRDEPAAGARGFVIERGAVSVLGVLWVDDGGALVADRPLPGLQVDLALVAPPGAVPHCHHRLAVGGGCRNGAAEHLIPVVFVGVVLHL